MSSKRPSTRAWESEWADVLQRIDADRDAALQRLELARRHLARARHWIDESDPDGALVEAETALVNAADAVLQRDGYRVRGKSGSHQARFDYPALPDVFANGRRSIERARRLRNTAQYEAAGRVSRADAEDITELAARAIEAVARG